MQYFALIIVLSVICVSQSVFVRLYNKRLEVSLENSAMLSVANTGVMAVAFWAMTGFQPVWDGPTIAYAIFHGVFLAFNLTANFLALMTGPYALTQLMTNTSLVLVTLFGIFFLREAVTVTMVIGMVFMGAALILLKEKTPEDCKLTLRWWIFVIINFVCNAGCGISTKLYQTNYPQGYNNAFMAYATTLSAILCIIYCFARKISWKHMKFVLSNGWAPMLGVGTACAIVNMLLMHLNTQVPASLLFPTLSGMNLVISALLSRFVYHEKATRRQKWSFAVGVCAIVLMNLG